MEGLRFTRNVESKESKELFRGSLSFDFIFTTNLDGSKHPYCVEIIGADSGIQGVQSIPKDVLDSTTRTLADIRKNKSDEHTRREKIASEIYADTEGIIQQASTKEIQEKFLTYIRASIRSVPFMKHAFVNPPLIETISNDKSLQEEYIPEQYRPRSYKEGESMVSSTGSWILKPFDGRAGEEIFIISNEEFASEYPTWELKNQFIAQELILPDGADLASDTHIGNVASLRLLMDFVYREDGSIDPIYEVAYQRVAPLYAGDIKLLSHAERIKAFVVNKSTGALSIPASQEEKRLAHDVSLQIVQALAEKYKQTVETVPKTVSYP